MTWCYGFDRYHVMSSAIPPAFSRVAPAAILTGGQARRFQGRDKTSLVVDPAGRSILEHQIELLAPIASEILIVTSAARAPEFSEGRLPAGSPASPAAAVRLRTVLDAHPGTGPLGAIVTALDATDADWLFVIAGDMPHVSATLLAALAHMHERTGNDATVPVSPRGLEPLCAIYARSARPLLAGALNSGDLSMQRALQRLRAGIMPAGDVAAHGDPAILFRNINRPEDLM